MGLIASLRRRRRLYRRGRGKREEGRGKREEARREWGRGQKGERNGESGAERVGNLSGSRKIKCPKIDGYDCIYVGKSETCIRRRLLDHLQNEPNPGLRRVLRTFRDMVQFSVAFTANAEETDALETAIIRDWQPETNRNKL